jgi:pimeloyl-ACP methyl ester carboxylesterase
VRSRDGRPGAGGQVASRLPDGGRRWRLRLAPGRIDRLRQRLAGTLWPPVSAAAGWVDGVDLTYLRELVEWWRTGYDWPARERELNRYRHYRIGVDGADLHVVCVSGRGPAPVPLLLTHGWPSTFYEFWPVISQLTDPAAYGADPGDAFDVVVPSLPGFGFSAALPGTGAAARIPGLWHRLMTEHLGYGRYGAHGGDIGAMVTNRLAIEYPEAVLGIHVTMPAEPHTDPSGLTAAERRYLHERAARQESGGAYAHLHRTRPDTLAVALHDSPAGLAAWIVDKWWQWSDCGDDLESRFTKDQLLTTVTLYWLTATIGTSMHVYRDWALGSPGNPHAWADRPHIPGGVDSRPVGAGERITVPAGVCQFDNDAPLPWISRAYADLRHHVRMPRGGHFPAVEEPDLLVADLRAFFRPLRS